MCVYVCVWVFAYTSELECTRQIQETGAAFVKGFVLVVGLALQALPSDCHGAFAEGTPTCSLTARRSSSVNSVLLGTGTAGTTPVKAPGDITGTEGTEGLEHGIGHLMGATYRIDGIGAAGGAGKKAGAGMGGGVLGGGIGGMLLGAGGGPSGDFGATLPSMWCPCP